MEDMKLVGRVKGSGNPNLNPDNQFYFEYYVTPDARIFKVRTNKGILEEVKPSLISRNMYKGKHYGGYYAVASNHLPEKYVHRIVATAFVHNDDPETKRIVDHIDGNKHNNHYTNLQWITQSENMKRAHARRKAMGKVWHGRKGGE